MFYIFHGDDDLSQQETLGKLLNRLGDPEMLDLNTSRFDGMVSLDELEQTCGAIPFLAPVRLVLVRNLFSTRPDKAYLDELAAYLPDLPETARVFFLESQLLSDNHAIVKVAHEAPNGYVRQFNRPEGKALMRWIEDQVQARQGQISQRAIHALAANIGNDLIILRNEIEKLVLYKGSEEQIEAEDVERLCPYVAEANIFELVDALGNQNGPKAAALLQKKYNEGVDPAYLFAMFVRQFRLLIQVKELAEAGLRPPAIAQNLRLHNFVAGKLHQQSRGFSLVQLEQIHRHLLDIDVRVKTGRADIHTSLNLLVAGLTAVP